MSGLPAGPFGVTLISTAAALLVMMAVTFAVALKAGKHSVVHTAWGIGSGSPNGAWPLARSTPTTSPGPAASFPAPRNLRP